MALHRIVRERQAQYRPAMTRQRQPEDLRDDVPKARLWDGPSSPIPNVGIARGRRQIMPQRGCRLRHGRVLECWNAIDWVHAAPALTRPM